MLCTVGSRRRAARCRSGIVDVLPGVARPARLQCHGRRSNAGSSACQTRTGRVDAAAPDRHPHCRSPAYTAPNRLDTCQAACVGQAIPLVCCNLRPLRVTHASDRLKRPQWSGRGDTESQHVVTGRLGSVVQSPQWSASEPVSNYASLQRAKRSTPHVDVRVGDNASPVERWLFAVQTAGRAAIVYAAWCELGGTPAELYHLVLHASRWAEARTFEIDAAVLLTCASPSLVSTPALVPIVR